MLVLYISALNQRVDVNPMGLTPRPRWCKGENVRSCEVQAVEQEGGEGLRQG